eukprot:PhF_6_TR14948/c0_g1_i2/m.23445
MTCKIEIIEARDLVPMDLNGKSDPFVVLFFGGHNIQKKRTSTRYTTLKPMWTESFFFTGSDQGIDTIRLEIWDEDQLKAADYMGEIEFAVCVASLDDPSGDITQGPLHEGDHWFPVKWRQPDGSLMDGDFGFIHVRWLYSRTMSLLSARDNTAPVTIKELEEKKTKEQLPSLDVAVIQANVDRIEVHLQSGIAPFLYLYSVIMWGNPLESVVWFWFALYFAYHEMLFSVVPLSILAIMAQNAWQYCRYGPQGRSGTTDLGAIKNEKPIRPVFDASVLGLNLDGSTIEQTRQLHRLARRFQKYTAIVASKLDFVADCLRWNRKQEALLITAVTFGVVFLPLLLKFLTFLVPPAYMFTIPMVIYLFTIYPLYENFPVIKRLYSPTQVARILFEQMTAIPYAFHLVYYSILKRIFRYNPEYAFQIQKFVTEKQLQRIESEVAGLYKISSNDKRTHVFVTVRAIRRLAHSVPKAGLSVRCSLEIPGYPQYKEERPTTIASSIPPVWNERVSFSNIPTKSADESIVLVVDFKCGNKVLATERVELSGIRRNAITETWLNLKSQKEVVAELSLAITPWNIGAKQPELIELEKARVALEKKRSKEIAAGSPKRSSSKKTQKDGESNSDESLMTELKLLLEEVQRLEDEQAIDREALEEALKLKTANRQISSVERCDVVESPKKIKGSAPNFTLAVGGSALSTKPTTDEEGYYCDACGWELIEGTVWQCQQCEDHTQCEMCYHFNNRGGHNPTHTFVVINDNATLAPLTK